jgi:hypothetical protein
MMSGALAATVVACGAAPDAIDDVDALGGEIDESSAESAFSLRFGCPAGFRPDLGGEVCISPRPVAWRALVKVRRVSPQFSSGALAYFNATESTEIVTIADSTVTPWRQELEGKFHYEHYSCVERLPGGGCRSRTVPTVSEPFLWVNQAGTAKPFDAYMSPNGGYTPFGVGTAKSIQVSDAWFGEKYHFAASAILCHGPDDTRKNDDAWDRCARFKVAPKSQRFDKFGPAEAWARQVQGPGYCLGDSFDEPTCTVPDWRIRCDAAGNCVLENTKNAAIPIVIGVGASVTAVQVAALFTAAVALGYVVNRDQNVFQQIAELRKLTDAQWANVWNRRRSDEKKVADKNKKRRDAVPPGEKPGPDQTCTDAVLKNLEAEKEKWCRKVRHCEINTSCEDFQARIRANSNCAYMRKVIMDVCYGGGDKTHRDERSKVLKSLRECIRLQKEARDANRCP